MPWSPARSRLLLALVIADLLLLATASATGARTTPSPPHGARVLLAQDAGDRLVDLTIDSPALGRTATVRSLTPDGWERRRPGQSWPTLYLLVGGDGNHKAWTEDYPVGLTELHELRNVLVVMPKMPLFGFCTDWHNAGRGGPPAVESFHLKEVLPRPGLESPPTSATAGRRPGTSRPRAPITAPRCSVLLAPGLTVSTGHR
ncbi:hypothetical protein [Streptomyces cadmiisoli]|uniref:hypothetical protein n=1 Tax=Streptomyces cadmiisoli TaxID=2184053 RepID=UPI003D72CB48